MMLNRLSTFFRTAPCTNLLTNLLRTATVPTQRLPLPVATGLAPVSSIVSRFNSSLVSPQQNGSVLEEVKKQVESGSEGRLFAVVQLCGKQFKITSGDIIIVEGYWPPTNGDQIRLDKVLLAGGKDFSLIGRPLVPQGLVDVRATIIEKSLSHTRTHFRKKRRKQYMRINFYRTQQTMIRINSIDVNSGGLKNRNNVDDVERFY
ncbi:39S ribosomal protein L21, mitochondrial [Aedes aegypti]|uniref:Large ribosomal subunit protein bL21m n=1 Tax=Aedes aegypti TaxID=7159 RepID=A0A1S4F453_AEDAE|nr:39S ribosomal protein L21, mitochondrial [Aedes aegypti]